MKFDTSGWKIFRFGDLISSIYKAKAFTKEAVDVCTKADDFVRYVSRTDSNNGVDMIVSRPLLGDVEEPNAITIGDTTATVYYQDGPFVCGDHIVVIRAEWMNMYTGLFIVGLLKQEHYRYSYGRAFLMNLIENTMLKLPATSDGTPDWEFMEDYMKSLHHKPLTTKNKPGNAPELETEKWGRFKVGELFELIPTLGKDSTELLPGDDISYIGAKKNDNGLIMRCQLSGFEDWVSKGKCIVFICLGAGSAGYATYQPDDFIGMNGKTICGYNEHLNDKTGNFIAAVLSCERPKYSFGRSWTGERLRNTIIKLPITSDGTPDWQFMEDYIKALPYGDRL